MTIIKVVSFDPTEFLDNEKTTPAYLSAVFLNVNVMH